MIEVERDRPVELEEVGKSRDAMRHTGSETSERCKDRLPFQRLPLSECYIKGIVDIVLKYRKRTIGHSRASDECAIFHLHHCLPGFGIDDIHTPEKRLAPHWQDALMLVCDVEAVQIPQIVLPFREGLNFCTDKISDELRRSVPSFYMSIDGTLDAGPSTSAERKSAVVGHDMPVHFDQNAVCVIKGDAEIVDSITQNGWKMAVRFGEENPSSRFECALLVLGTKSFSVFRDVSSQKTFELVDVMVGPFYLQ